MVAKRFVVTFLAFAVTVGICRVAHANSVSPFVYFWPGIISLGLTYAFPASLLAAFIERPFLTAAGIERRVLVLSLRANFVSTIVGILLVPIGYPALYTIGPLWCIAAFGVSCVVEILCLRRFGRQSFAWRWVVGGNAISSVVLMMLPPIALATWHISYRFARSFEMHEMWLAWSSFGVSIILFLASFMLPIAASAPLTDSESPVTTSSEKDSESDCLEIEAETAG